MKKVPIIAITCFLLLFTSACRSHDKPADDAFSIASTVETSEEPGDQTQPAASSESNDNQPAETIGAIPSDAVILNSDKVDLNADGAPEKVTIYQLGPKTSDSNGEQEGRLRIEEEKSGRDVPFIKKQAGLTGVYTSVEYADLDSDGTKDVFIITPDNGAQFSLSYFSIYSLSQDKLYTFNVDNDLSNFAAGFSFKYKGNGLLQMSGSQQNFSTELDISDNDAYSKENEELNQYFEKSWVEPVPVDIGAGSKLKLEASGAIPLIKVPLPIFGQATSNIIGEVDLFYRVGSDFTPVPYRFEVYDFKGINKSKVGEGSIK